MVNQQKNSNFISIYAWFFKYVSFEEIRTKIKNKDAILILMVLVALVPFKQSVLSSRLYYTEYITNKESEIVATKISNRIEEVTGSYNPEEKLRL